MPKMILPGVYVSEERLDIVAPELAAYLGVTEDWLEEHLPSVLSEAYDGEPFQYEVTDRMPPWRGQG